MKRHIYSIFTENDSPFFVERFLLKKSNKFDIAFMFFNFDLQYKLHWTPYGLEKHPPKSRNYTSQHAWGCVGGIRFGPVLHTVNG